MHVVKPTRLKGIVLTIFNNKHILIFFILIVWPVIVFAAAKTIDTPGTWSDTGIWVGGIPGSTGDDVTLTNSLGTVTVTSDVTITTLGIGHNNVLTINSGVTMTIDNTDLTALSGGNGGTINVIGDLVINGDLILLQGNVLNVTGTLTVNGSITVEVGTDLNISGSMNVTGDFTGDNDTDFDVSGTVTIGGNLHTEGGSELIGSGTVTVGGCTGHNPVCNDSQLPIKILYFEAIVISEKCAVELNWATVEEENFDYFSVERSVDGINYSKIGEVKGNGWSQEIITYFFTDVTPVAGRAYYRLKSIDFDGYVEYHRIEKVDYTGYIKLFSVYPNPVINGDFKINLSRNPEGVGKLVLLNVLGREVYSLSLKPGVLEYNIFDFIQKGLFYLRVDLSGVETYTEKVLVK
ncbi:MAG: hypothetical protein OEX02_12965 [Cyclobacteriaceae bacterium]|nr:hypothetical protein [Cyclobacteriaceae bacterium]